MENDNYQMLCPGCFAQKDLVQVCPHCDYDENVPRHAHALPHRTLLQQHFLIGRVLGEPGGFGITYLAWDTHLETTVAIKEFLPPDLAFRVEGHTTVRTVSQKSNEVFQYGLGRFIQEARILARFDHKNLVRIRHFFRENSTGYMVMDYHEGCTLSDYLKICGGRLPETEAVDIILEVLKGLQHVHTQGFLHRDIKPSNIFRTIEGRIIILDFGSARMALGLRKKMTVVLTRHFAPPEQYLPEGRQGPWTDIFTSAATLYYLITGKAIIEGHGKIDVDKWDSVPISGKLKDHLKTALSADPNDRPQSVFEFAQMLIDFREESSDELGSEETTVLVTRFGRKPDREKPSAPEKRTRAGWIVGAVSLLGLLAILIIVFSTRMELPEKVTSVMPEPEDEMTALHNAENNGTNPDAKSGAAGASVATDSIVVPEPPPTIPRIQKLAVSIQSNPPGAALIIRGSGPEFADIETVTPYLDSLPAASYRLELASDDYAPLSQSFELFSNGPPYSKVFDLTPIGSLFIKTDPPGANVTLDGANPQSSPIIFDGLAVGSYELNISKEGYEELKAAVTVAHGVIDTLSFLFSRPMGQLTVSVAPYGEIYIDDELIKRENLYAKYSTEIASGTHKIRVEHPVLGVVEKEVEIEPNNSNPVSIDLIKEGPVSEK